MNFNINFTKREIHLNPHLNGRFTQCLITLHKPSGFFGDI